MNTETLTCRDCGTSWDREVKRGRKPTQCDPCKGAVTAKPKKKTPVLPEILKEAEAKYKQRVQVAGRHFKPLGDPEIFVGSTGIKLKIFHSFEIEEGVVSLNTFVRESGMQGRYKFRSLAVREDGTAYANLIGVSGTYEGKYRALGVEQLTLSN